MPVTDFLDDTSDPYARAYASGASRAQADLGVGAPVATRSRAVAAPKAFDPLDDPRFKQASLARKELHSNEQLYHQRLKDFDATEGAPLKWKSTPGALPGDDPIAIAKDPTQQALLSTLQNSPGSADNVAATRKMQLLAQKRDRLSQEANRITQNRIQFDEQTFMPLRDQLMSRTQTSAPTAPVYKSSDYLAPSEDTPLNNRIADINARRERLGQAPLAPGSVSAGNFTERWVPPDQRTPTPDQTETNSEGLADFSPQNNPPGDETAYGGRDSAVPDALADGDARHAAMADDLKAQFQKASALDRLKMMFGSKGYGQNEPEMAKPMIGSEVAGTEGGLFTIPKMQGDSALAGAVNAANAFSSGLTSPENAAIAAATGGAGELAAAGGAIGRAAQAAKTIALGGFAGQMAKDVPQQVKDAYAVIRDPKSTHADIARAITTPGLNAFMMALAAHGTVDAARGIKGAVNPAPDSIDFNRENPAISKADEAPPPVSMVEPKPLSLGESAAMADESVNRNLEATRAAVQKIGATPIEPATTNPASPTTEEPPNAIPIKSAAENDVQSDAGNGEAVGGGNAVDQKPARESQTAEGQAGEAAQGAEGETGKTAESEGLSGGSGEPKPLPPTWKLTVQEPQGDVPGYHQVDMIDQNGNNADSTTLDALKQQGYAVPFIGDLKQGQYELGNLPDRAEPISSETQPTSENTGETSYEPTQQQPSEPVVSGLDTGSPIADQHGSGPAGRLLDAGSEQSDAQRPDRDSGGEQSRGDQGNGPQSSGAGGSAAGNADIGLAGDAGRAVTPEVQTEPAPAGEEPPGSSIKNASVDALSREEGLGARLPREGTTTDAMHDQANARIAGDEDAGKKLVDQLAKNPRQIDGPESILITHEITRNRNARKVASADLDKAIESGDPDAIARAQATKDSLRDEFNKLADVSEQTGTKWSDVGRARQLALKEDFSPENLERQWVQTERAGGKEITPYALEKARAEFKQKSAEYERTLEASEKARVAAEQGRAEAETDLAIHRLTQKVAWEKSAPPKAVRAGVLQSIIERGDEAMARLVAKRKSGEIRSSVVGGLEDAHEYAQIVAGWIAKGIKSGAELSAELVKHFGEGIRPHIADILKRGTEEHAKTVESMVKTGRDTPRERRSTVDTMKARVAEGDKVSDLGHYVQAIAEQHIRNGVKGREAVLDATHETLKEVHPEITRTETMHALSDYGKTTELSKDPVKVELRDVKGQLQQISKLQDMNEGRAPKRTGPERRTPSDEERRLTKQVEDIKKKAGWTVTDPAKQLKSALSEVKTRLRNQIKDLDFQIATGKKIVRDKTPSPSDAESTALTAQRDALKKQYDEIFTKPEMTDAQRMARAGKHLESEINRLSYQLRTGEVFEAGKRAKLTSPELDAKRARIEALKAERDYARMAIQPRPNPATPAEAKAAALDSQIAAIEKQIKGGNIFDKEKKQPVESTPEIEARQRKLAELKAEREGLRESIQPRDREAENLQALKANLANRHAADLERLARQKSGDFTKPASRVATKADKEYETALAENQRVKKSIAEGQRAHEKSVRPTWVKGMDYAARFVRGGVLTWPTTIAKLAATTVQQGLIHPMDEMAGSIYRKALPGVFDKAKIEGSGFNVEHQAKAITQGITQGWKDLKDTLDKSKGNMSEIEARYGKGGADRDVLELGSILHGAEKAPLKRFAFTYAMEKQVSWALQHGVTEAELREPLMQMRMGAEAYRYASRMLFQEDNVVSNGFNRALSALREKDKETGRPSPVRITGETLARVLLPVAKVGTNIVNQTFARAMGLPYAAAETINAYRRGIENLSSEEADMIARHLKKGSVGLAIGTLAFLNPKIFGGFYRKGEKRDPKDLKPGEVKLPVTLPHVVSPTGNIPSYLNHGAASEVTHFYATLRRAMDAKAKKSDTEPQGIGAGALAAMAGLAKESPYVRTAEDAVGALEPSGAGTLAGSIARSTIPGIVQWGAGKLDENSAGDTIQRKPTTFAENVEMGIPGARQNVPQRSYVDATVAKELGDHGLTVPDVIRPRIGPPNKKVGVDDNKFLSFRKEVGEAVSARLQRELPRLSALPPDRAQAMVNKIAEDEHVRARVQLELRERHKSP